MLPHTGVNTEDEQLVKTIIAGDKEAFRVLIQRYEKLVISIVFKMIERQEDREDLCQEVFISVYEKLQSFRYQSKLGTWIGNIAFNKCVNLLQKNKYRLTDELHAGESEKSAQVVDERFTMPDTQLEQKEHWQILQECAAALSPVQRTALHLFHYHGNSLEEISQVMDIPINTVKSHLNRGRKTLKETFVKRTHE
jgi:RNA polymerase sigma factor (sigma-70 family)